MKKLLLGTALLVLLGSAPAALALDQGEPRFYVGLEAGHLNTNLKISEDGKVDGQSISGYTGGIFGGYTVDIGQKGFGGVELNLGFGGPDFIYTDVDNGHTDRYEIKQRESYAARFLGGVKSSETTRLYGLLGFKKARYEVNDSDEAVREKFRVNGANLGVGAMVDIADQVAVRLEWTQTFYSKKYSAKLTENLVQVGLLRTF